MCGRYAFFQRPSEVRRQLEDAHMPSQEAPEDDEVRQTYNFPPGSFGLVYRADVPHTGAPTKETTDIKDSEGGSEDDHGEKATQYKLQAMKWGLIPFFTKRSPDYGSMLKTINCRDDSLLENRGIWTVPKMKKRCVVICQGFYEWLKKNDGKQKLPHYVKRKDGQPMCFAGLWDCVQYEGSEEKHYTYTIITTSPNKQLKFLHDRMPVILDNGSDDLFAWLDPTRTTWTKELQSLLRPYEGELACYPVSQEVGKVGNNSSKFIVPVDSAENKSNIANFFGNQKKKEAASKMSSQELQNSEGADKVKVEQDEDESRITIPNLESTEDNAPLPVPPLKEEKDTPKRSRAEAGLDDVEKEPKQEAQEIKKQSIADNGESKLTPRSSRGTKSATSNAKASPTKKTKLSSDGSQKITSFFGK